MEMTFSEKAIAVFTVKGYSPSDIDEAKEVIREAWKDKAMKQLWIDWIDEQHLMGWR